ncbi:transferase hexapeptide (six repeat-containing protein) [Cyclobacterium xiamenense]|uniref:Transferase hexapeptide (Six repeat-containing protein) n=1 Tax=Cyclobacterium xiamenense TaxID=1297121 RepID=A0A1H6TBU9_9BACT|nr:acyltransferase [Cyclobacterium xiamenense]SEI73715.1 transferase hexapeptide (six repeat-containing protein) [Cyclobacterium xiamenense]
MVQQQLADRLSRKSEAIYGREARNTSEKIGLYWAFLREVMQGLYRIVNAKYRLRKCAALGKLVTVRGRLRVEGLGEIRVGDRCTIWSHMGTTQLYADRGAVLDIGEGTFINTACIISASERITIGKNCQVANQVIIMDGDFHGVDDRSEKGKSGAITIEDGAWLATRCMVLKGVRIGKGATVAAGAVVTKDVAPYTLVGGVPAQVIRKLATPESEPAIQEDSRA